MATGLNNICETPLDPSIFKSAFYRTETMESILLVSFPNKKDSLKMSKIHALTTVNLTRSLLNQTPSDSWNTVNMKNYNVILGFTQVKREISKL